MYKFDSSSIVGNYIKQLLHSFHLPTYRVYTKEQERYNQKIEAEIQQLQLEVGKVSILLKREVIDKEKQELEEKLSLLKEQIYLLENSKELNVFSTFYRDDSEVYPNSKNWRQQQVQYPKVMTYIPYIKDNMIQEYICQTVDGHKTHKWIKCHGDIDLFKGNHEAVHDRGGYLTSIPYIYNRKYLNRTKNLKIENNIYDSYTHEYLGDYLRFQRDYNDLDLMPLYNCFSNRTCNLLDFSIEIGETRSTSTVTGEFKTTDSNYKIYMVPVKLCKEYTIAIECKSYVEVFCGLYDTNLSKLVQTNGKFSNLPKATYTYFNSMQFKTPVLYDKLTKLSTNLFDNNSGLSQEELLADLAQHEQNLKLFIKIPANVKSSIVVLEGNFTAYNNEVFNKKDSVWSRRANYNAYNYAEVDKYENFNPITTLQLLKINTGESYPFADRLVDYLTEMSITHLDENEDNIKRVKELINKNTPDITNDTLWSDKIKFVLYEYMNTKANTLDKNSDILGYVDKIVESNYKTDYLTRLNKALNKYNKSRGDQPSYSTANLTQLFKVPGLLDALIAIDPKLSVFKDYDGTKAIDDTIASIDIYADGGNGYGR